MCLKSGLPRRTGCPHGQVYNPATFFCDKPENVPGWCVFRTSFNKFFKYTNLNIHKFVSLKNSENYYTNRS